MKNVAKEFASQLMKEKNQPDIVPNVVVQEARTSQLLNGVPALVSYLSGVCELRPGDLVFTGTPSGVGLGRTPPQYLDAGDVLVSTIDGIGSLVNQCV